MGMRAHNARWFRAAVPHTPSNTFVRRPDPSADEVRRMAEAQKQHDEWIGALRDNLNAMSLARFPAYWRSGAVGILTLGRP